MSNETSPQPAARARTFASLAKAGLGVFLTLIPVALVCVLVVPALLGYERYVITGGSMEPNIPRGSISYAEEVPVGALRESDVITYVPPGHTRPVTHRIKEIQSDNGRNVLQTMGDANRNPDVRLFALTRPTQARYAFHVPYIGWGFMALAQPLTRFFLLGVPAFLVALVVLRSLWREGGELQARERETVVEGEA